MNMKPQAQLTSKLRADDPADPPRAHYNYDDIDVFCRCPLCQTYFSAVQDYEHFLSLTTGHRWHCPCYLCGQRRAFHQISLAQGSRRDLYCELSFLTHEHPFAPQFLGWILRLIRDTSFHTDTWWATHSHKRPLSAWMNDWQKAHLSPAMIAVSGMC